MIEDCAGVDLHEEWDYNVDPPKFLGYLGEITIYLKNNHVTIGYLTVEQIENIATDIINDLQLELEVMEKLRR